MLMSIYSRVTVTLDFWLELAYWNHCMICMMRQLRTWFIFPFHVLFLLKEITFLVNTIVSNFWIFSNALIFFLKLQISRWWKAVLTDHLTQDSSNSVQRLPLYLTSQWSLRRFFLPYVLLKSENNTTKLKLHQK